MLSTVFSSVEFADLSLKDMLEESWRDCEARRMERFWQENVDPTVGKCFGLKPLPKYEKLVEQRMQSDTVELIAEGGFMASKDGLIDEDDLFNLDSEVSPRDAEAQRVLRIALILHNLSFEEANAQILAQNQGFLRMMMLSSLSRWASLRQVGLDCLSNIAPHLQLNVHDDLCCRSLLRLTVDGILKSEDRGLVTRCLDILAHLAQCENNQGTLVAELDHALFERLLELLTVHDVLLIIHSLETLFALTELGDGICERLVAIKHAIGEYKDNLFLLLGLIISPFRAWAVGNRTSITVTVLLLGIIVSMLSLDPILYGPSAQRNMKIVEHFDPTLPPVVNPNATHIQIQTIQAATPVQHVVRPAQPNVSIQGECSSSSHFGVPSSSRSNFGTCLISGTRSLQFCFLAPNFGRMLCGSELTGSARLTVVPVRSSSSATGINASRRGEPRCCCRGKPRSHRHRNRSVGHCVDSLSLRTHAWRVGRSPGTVRRLRHVLFESGQAKCSKWSALFDVHQEPVPSVNIEGETL